MKTTQGRAQNTASPTRLPPPPPNQQQPVLGLRSSVDGEHDEYSSDEDHVSKASDFASPSKVNLQQPVPVLTSHSSGNDNSMNSSGGSVGKELVYKTLTRPHPRGATVSRRERVRRGKWKQGNR